MALRAQFQMFLHINSTPDFHLVQALIQDLLLQSLLKVATLLEHVRKCYVQYNYIKKEKI